MFAGDIDEVTSTRILVAPIYRSMLITAKDKLGRIRKFKKPTGKPMQLVVYSNTVRSESGGYMILPFPVLRGQRNRVMILDFAYDNIFDDLTALFETDDPMNVGQLSRNPNGTRPDNIVPVVNTSSYTCRILANLEELVGLDLSDNLVAFAKQYYPRGFGFIVCSMKRGAIYRPFAYCHELRHDGKLFVPLRRCFSAAHSPGSLGSLPDSQLPPPEEEEEDMLRYYKSVLTPSGSEDEFLRFRRTEEHRTRECVWDHIVYIVNRSVTNGNAQKPIQARFDALYSYINTNLLPRQITFGKIGLLRRIYLGKKHSKNSDLYF